MILTNWYYGLPADDLWQTDTCRRCNVLIIELCIDIVHLIGYNEKVYQSRKK